MLVSNPDSRGCYIFIHDPHNNIKGFGKLACVFVNNSLGSERPDLTVCTNPKDAWNSAKEYVIDDGVFGKAVCATITKLIKEGKVKPYVG